MKNIYYTTKKSGLFKINTEVYMHEFGMYVIGHNGQYIRVSEIKVKKWLELGYLSEEKHIIFNDEATVEMIKKVVCCYFNMVPEVLDSNSRKREIVQARQIAMHFAKDMTDFSTKKIGEKIGAKDHATVIHSCKKVSNLCENNKVFKKHVNDIEEILG